MSYEPDGRVAFGIALASRLKTQSVEELGYVTVCGPGAEQLVLWLRGSVSSPRLTIVPKDGQLFVDARRADPAARIASVDLPSALCGLDKIVDLEGRLKKMLADVPVGSADMISAVASAALAEYTGEVRMLSYLGKPKSSPDFTSAEDPYHDPDMEIPDCFRGLASGV